MSVISSGKLPGQMKREKKQSPLPIMIMFVESGVKKRRQDVAACSLTVVASAAGVSNCLSISPITAFNVSAN
jgi:hypothetical protein